MKLLLVALFASFLASANSQLPEGCFDPPGNGPLGDMVVAAIEASRPLLVTGIPPFIPPLDPLGPIPAVYFHIDTVGLRMDGFVNHTLVKNLAQFIICSLNISVGITQKFEVEFRLDNFHLDGTYEVDGLIASLFPVFGSGKYRLDAYETGFSGGAKLTYNLLTDHASIKNLKFDVFFKRLEMEMECINGCGDMSDLINDAISQIAPVVFEAVWNAIEEPLADVIEKGINEFLKNISISDVITPDKSFHRHSLELGNANGFMDLIMDSFNDAIVSADLDPALLPDFSSNIGLGYADFYEGQLVGFSKMHRSGTCTLDKVASWVFLYANIGVENLEVHYKVNVTSNSITSLARVSGILKKASVYMVARKDTYGLFTDIDQFVITEFGSIDIDIQGLGVLGFLLEPLTEVVMNLMEETIANVLETEVKDLLQDILHETPWP